MRESIRESPLAEQFDTPEQQREASLLGLWTFLITEIMFFGGLFLGYIVYRSMYPEAFAEGGLHNNLWLGTINTVVLLTSSLTMALAVHAAQLGRQAAQVRYLWLTAGQGMLFLLIKAVEYYQHAHEQLVPGIGYDPNMPPRTELFFVFYYAMTGLHAVHVLVGVGLLAVMAVWAQRRRFDENYYTPIELSGLYWHFVDVVWVFLFPLMYLINRTL